MPADQHTKMIPARFIGSYRVYLKPNGERRYEQPDGTPLPTKTFTVRTADGKDHSMTVGILEPGDVMLCPANEVLGQTYLSDPTQQRADLLLGDGWCVLPQHAGKTRDELGETRFTGPDGVIRYYRFEEGRPDFEPVEVDANGQVVDPAPPPSADDQATDHSTPAPSTTDQPGTVVAALPAQSRVRRPKTALDKGAADVTAQQAAGESLPLPEYRSGTPSETDPAAPTPAPSDAADDGDPATPSTAVPAPNPAAASDAPAETE